jgi:hypothetical protein
MTSEERLICCGVLSNIDGQLPASLVKPFEFPQAPSPKFLIAWLMLLRPQNSSVPELQSSRNEEIIRYLFWQTFLFFTLIQYIKLLPVPQTI